MLFDNIFKNPSWQGKDSFPSCVEWENEINSWLEFIKTKNQLNRFIPRLNATKTQRDEALAEIRAAYVVETKMNYHITDWERQTIGGRDVDLVILNNSKEIYCEIKSPGWESELNHKEIEFGRTKLPKYIHAEARSVGPWQSIQYSISKAYNKFLPNTKNLVIICPDLFNPDLLNEISCDLNIRNALYNPYCQYNTLTKKDENGYFLDKTYEKVGGLLIIEANFFCKDNGITYKYEFFKNSNSKNPFFLKT